MFAVQGLVQAYPWGPLGLDNAVSFFAGRQNVKLENNQHKAELWLGAHPNGTAMVAKVASAPEECEPRELSKLLAGQKMTIPFLMKVLSVDRALSIQMHPDRETATKLYARDPQHYKDPFDKPEMCIPLSNGFELFCGFLKAREICVLAEIVPFLNQLIRKIDDIPDHDKESSHPLQHINEAAFYRGLIAAFYAEAQDVVENAITETLAIDPNIVNQKAIRKAHKSNTSILKGVVDAITGSGSALAEYKELIRDTFDTFKYLQSTFPTDRGCFAAFFLAKHTLVEAQPFVIPPNTLHAYLKGECLEIMKNSDNVIRAGLTTKFQDVDSIISYTSYARFKPAALAHCKVATDKNSAEKYTLNVYTPKCTEAFRIAILSVSMGCTAQINLDKHIPELREEHGKIQLQEILCLCGVGELIVDDSRHTIEAGSCILLTNKFVHRVSAVSESAVDGYLTHGNALTLVFAWGTGDQEPKRRTSVMASSLVETTPSSMDPKASEEPTS